MRQRRFRLRRSFGRSGSLFRVLVSVGLWQFPPCVLATSKAAVFLRITFQTFRSRHGT